MLDAPVTTLLWVRHGEADSNRDGRFGGHSPVPLTPRGVRQAQVTARAIAHLNPTAIVTSDIVRARQTAEPIADACRLDLTIEPGLRERSLGILDGLSFVEAEQKHPEIFARLRQRAADAIPEGGETNEQVYARVAGTLERLVEEHAGGRVVVVSHGLALYHAFCHVCGLGVPTEQHNVFVLVDNCSLSRVEHRFSREHKVRWRIVSLNDTGHLAGVE